MRPRTRRLLAWALWVFALILAVANMTLNLLNASRIDVGDLVLNILLALMGLAYATLGAVVVGRKGNMIGWLFAVMGGGFIIAGLGEQYALHATVVAPGSLAAPGVAAILPAAFGISASMIPLVFLLFPDGHAPGRRWRLVGWVTVGSALTAIAAFAIRPGPLNGSFNDFGVHLDNPIGIPGAGTVATLVVNLLAPVALVGGIACVVAMVLRFRRSIGEEHQQLRWLAYVGAIAISMVVSITATGPIVGDESLVSNIFWTGFVFSLGLGVPIACGVAIFRFHLYDLDVVIRKTVVFTVVAVVLTSLYLAVIAVATIGNVSRILVGVILLAVTFNPVRKAARSLADRIAYGKRASSYEVLTEFSERMSETYATDDVLPRMVQILAGATGAEHAGVWLRVGGSLRLDATWPDGATGASVAMRGDDGLPTLPADDAIEVRHQGELLGALTVSMPANDPIDPAKDKLIRDLASQAGLVLRNVRLIEELRASRQRLVSAQDEERRKIERNLHDGAQQQLVALSVQVKLARAILERDPGKAAGMLDAVQGAAGEALEELRDLARGIYPPLLADQGLTVALEAQARKSPIQVSVNAGGIGRYGQDIEAAVYFCALEALQNVAKYAEAATITVQLRADDGHLTFEVTDDGRGFDRTANAYGTGLQGMTDRLDAIGGRLDVRSAPGEGTTVTGRIRTRTLSAG